MRMNRSPRGPIRRLWRHCSGLDRRPVVISLSRLSVLRHLLDLDRHLSSRFTLDQALDILAVHLDRPGFAEIVPAEIPARFSTWIDGAASSEPATIPNWHHDSRIQRPPGAHPSGHRDLACDTIEPTADYSHDPIDPGLPAACKVNIPAGQSLAGGVSFSTLGSQRRAAFCRDRLSR